MVSVTPAAASLAFRDIHRAGRGQAIAIMLDRWPDTEVAICVSDLSAFGALMECKRRGLDVPGDIAIAGFGDYEVGA